LRSVDRRLWVRRDNRPSTFSILHSQFFNLFHGQQQRRLNLLPHAAADVAIAVEAFDEEEVGIVVLLEEGLLGVGELPVVANVAVGDRGLDNVRLIELLISGIWRKSIGRSMRINYPAEYLAHLDNKVVQVSEIGILQDVVIFVPG
jgi:hypothetical protein